jgi:hypothetical protein
MGLFIVVPSQAQPELDASISDKFQNLSFKLASGEWFVSYDGTSRQLSDFIGITVPPNAPAIVLNFSGYWGRANPDVWEWLKVNASVNS